MIKTSASEFQKRVGEFSDIARREPVTVTRHGRASVVLISAEDYARLRAYETRASTAVHVSELPDETMEAILNADLSHLPND